MVFNKGYLFLYFDEVSGDSMCSFFPKDDNISSCLMQEGDIFKYIELYTISINIK